MKLRTALVAASSATALLVGAAAAYADDISNSLDSTIDATAEVMSLTAGGPTGSTVMYVTPANGDGKNGCNLTGSTTVGFDVQSSNPGVATVSPSSLTFTSCGDTKTVTVTPLTAGSATVSLNLTHNSTEGSFNVAPATFVANVTAPTPTNTPPSVDVTGVEAGEAYAKGSVPVATCAVTDAEDGASAFAAALSGITGPYAADGIGQQTATCSYTDGGGLTAAASVTYSIVDVSAPAVSYTLSPSVPDGQNGWYIGDVELTWTVTEGESPSSLSTIGCTDTSVTADQGATEYSCSASSAGGAADPVTVSIKRDATAPQVQLVGGPADGASYYFGQVPGAPTCQASDALSGLDGPCSVEGYSASVGAHVIKASARDNAGNSGTQSASYEVHAWTLSGFYQPVDLKGTLNTVKGGSTVPLKFEVFAGATELTDTSVVTSFATKSIACDTSALTDEIEFVTTGGTQLRYDTTAGQFIQNWQTPKKPGSCYRVTMTTQDGSTISADFKLK